MNISAADDDVDGADANAAAFSKPKLAGFMSSGRRPGRQSQLRTSPLSMLNGIIRGKGNVLPFPRDPNIRRAGM
jgi:hypothetical protein